VLYESPSASPAHTPATLEDYLEALRARKLLVAMLTIGLFAISFVYTRQREATYEATAKILVNPTAEGGNFGSLVNPNLEREVSIVVGDTVATEARKAAAVSDPAALTEGGVTASYAPNSDVITIAATSLSATRAASLASAYATAYVTGRLGGQSGFYDKNIQSIDDELATLTPRIAEAEQKIADLDNQIAGLKILPATADRDVLIAQLESSRSNIDGPLGSDTARKTTIENSKADLLRNRDTQQPAAVVISAAKAPDSPLGLPNWAFWLFGVIGGFLVGAILAFVLERLDRRAQSTRDVELAIGRPVLGAIPRFSWRFRRGKWALVMANNRPVRSLQTTREAYRRLRSSVMFLTRADGARVIVITSNQALEGKSTTAANLAATIAMGGTTVALVSADLRRPSLETLFELNNDRGLADYLGAVTETVRAERFASIEGLAVIPSGHPPANPGEQLSSRRFAALIEQLRAQFDLVIIDTPPLGAAADALAAAVLADGVLLVVDGKRTETTDLLAIRNDLDRSGIALLGAVLNRDKAQRGGLLRRSGRYSYYGKHKDSGAATATARDSVRLADELTVVQEDSGVVPAAVTLGSSAPTLAADEHVTDAPAADPHPRPQGREDEPIATGGSPNGDGHRLTPEPVDDAEPEFESAAARVIVAEASDESISDPVENEAAPADNDTDVDTRAEDAETVEVDEESLEPATAEHTEAVVEKVVSPTVTTARTARPRNQSPRRRRV